MSILLETTHGNLVIDLDYEAQPLLAVNFLRLCQLNQYFFSPFYNIIKDRQITCGNCDYPQESGCYGANYYIDMTMYDQRVGNDKYLPVLDEKHSNLQGIGLVSFVKLEGNKVGSEFTISLSGAEDAGVPFGKVVEGFMVLDYMNNSLIDDEHRLVENVRIIATYTLYDPFPRSLEVSLKKKEPVPTKVQLENIRLSKKDKQSFDSSTIRALALELIGDLPDYKIQPSPKVLFVAKLNKITTEESLMIIFSKFGRVTNCNIITQDKSKSNYGFVEFDTKIDAEKAYSKLNQQSCIIDGNEVYVDFSQSIRKRENKRHKTGA